MPYADLEKQREYQRQWMAKRRAEYRDDQVCARCGGRDALELHHLDPTQKVNHRIWSWARARIAEELAKCQWLCHRCHKDTHGRSPHGSTRRYIHYKCRCSLCRAANAKSERERRARRAAEG